MLPRRPLHCTDMRHPIGATRSPRKNRGTVLFIALIALVALTLAGIALVRSVDTGNVIAGNFAFKQAALQATDAGVETAFSALPNIIATSLDANIPNQYFASIQPVDATGIPTTVNWNNVPSTTVSGNGVQYVIDRLCNGPLPVTDIQGNCLADQPKGSGSKKAGAVVFSSSTSVYYRVTVRVTGARNTVSVSQAMLSY